MSRFVILACMSLLLLANSLRAQGSIPDTTRLTGPRAPAVDTTAPAVRAAIQALAQRKVDSMVASALLASRDAENGDRRAQRRIIMFVLPLMMAVVLLMLFTDLVRQRDVAIESHWGGFGGGAVGTRLSRPLVLMLLLILLSGMLTAVALVWYSTPEAGSVSRKDGSNADSIRTTAATATTAPGVSVSGSPAIHGK